MLPYGIPKESDKPSEMILKDSNDVMSARLIYSPDNSNKVPFNKCKIPECDVKIAHCFQVQTFCVGVFCPFHVGASDGRPAQAFTLR